MNRHFESWPLGLLFPSLAKRIEEEEEKRIKKEIKKQNKEIEKEYLKAFSLLSKSERERVDPPFEFENE